MKHDQDIVAQVPELEGVAGRAWLAKVFQEHGFGAVICLWLIEAPAAHPFWHSYVLSLVHLRKNPILPPPIVHLQGATHELVLHALDPRVPRHLVLDGVFPAILQPSNFAAQLVADGDDAALERVEAAVRMIVDGRLSPDTDYRQQWMSLFGTNMVRG